MRVYHRTRLAARCRCSRERVETVLRVFPPDELDDMQKERVTTVTCGFAAVAIPSTPTKSAGSRRRDAPMQPEARFART